MKPYTHASIQASTSTGTPIKTTVYNDSAEAMPIGAGVILYGVTAATSTMAVRFCDFTYTYNLTSSWVRGRAMGIVSGTAIPPGQEGTLTVDGYCSTVLGLGPCAPGDWLGISLKRWGYLEKEENGYAAGFVIANGTLSSGEAGPISGIVLPWRR